MNIRFLKILLLLPFLQACREEIVLQTDTHDEVLVVDGMITNEPGPYEIKLSKSSNVNYPALLALTDCEITIYDDNEFSEILTESGPGIYKTSEGGIQGIVGNQYRISITDKEGVQYETEFQELKEPVGIDSVYAELIKKEVIEFRYGLPGYQFYIDTETAENQENYLLLNMVETYQYTANYQAYNVFNTEGSLAYYHSLYICWKTQDVNYFFTAKTNNLSSPKIVHKPLHFVSTETRRLQERYSLLVRQYSITKDAYYFWRNVETQISEENYLFSTQPFNIWGNVKNINDEDEIVYGYFTVASVTEKRIFVNRPHVTFYYPDRCGINYNYDDLIAKGYPIFLVMLDDGLTGSVIEGCINCTSEGGEPTRPDFW